jgi:hypothetical protein
MPRGMQPRRHYADQSAETINCAMPYPPRMTAAKLPATMARTKAAVMAIPWEGLKAKSPLPRHITNEAPPQTDEVYQLAGVV